VKRFAVLALLVLLQISFFVSGAATAKQQIQCYPEAIFAEAAKDSHGEIPFWIANDIIEDIEYRMYVNPSNKTFTLTVVFPGRKDQECVVFAGKDFRSPYNKSGTES
tara:strand:- start:29 stop:349 length:321 start_codon:yes stop_codon:yes gene_type:complete